MEARDEDRSPAGIAAGLARRIHAGELVAGDRLPTVRQVAVDLGVSPATVSAAWQALVGAGLVVTRGRAGTFVLGQRSGWLPPRYRDLAGPAGSYRLDLSSGTPDPQLLPSLRPALARLAARDLTGAIAGTGSYVDPPVLPALERQLRATWPFSPGALTVVDGALDAIGRTLEEVAGFGARVVVENPCFPPLLDLLDHLGLQHVPVALDAAGIRPDELGAALATSPAALVLQPRAHNPTGVSMTRARATELAEVLRAHPAGRDVVVVEDDHSGAIATTREVSLGSHLPGQVVHVRGFSKSHGPELRIAAVGGPARLIERLVARRMLGPGWTSRMLQSVLLDLLTDADAVAAVSEARRLYYARQRHVVREMVSLGVPVRAGDGINLWVPVADEEAALALLAAHGVLVARGAPFASGPSGAASLAHVRATVGLVRGDFEDVARLLAAAARA